MLISVLLIPFYISRIGVEGFGLLSFFIMLQAWAQILDAGVGGSLSRQTSVTKNNKIIFTNFLRQFYIVVSFFLAVASIFLIVGYIGRTYVASSWLNSDIELNVLEISIVAMFTTLSIRYLSGPFRSGLVGLEKHGTLSLSTFIFVSLRFPLGLVILDIFDNSLTHYFIYQALVAFVELLVVGVMFVISSKKAMEVADGSVVSDSKGTTLKSLLVFSAQLSMLSITWVIVTQIDKLVLSKFIELKDFGYYTLAVSVASVMTILSAPLSQVLMPRLSALASQEREEEYLDIYIKSFIGLSVLAVSLAIFMTLFSDKLLLIWTGDKQVTEEAYPFVKWLILGNAISVLMNCIFLLQYSIGKLKAHLIAYLLYSLFLIPASVYIAYRFQASGAAIFWFIHNLLFFVVWGTIVHRKYLVGVASYIWIKILVPCLVISLTYMTALKSFVVFSGHRGADFLILFFIGLSNVALLLGYFWFLKHQGGIDVRKLRFNTLV